MLSLTNSFPFDTASPFISFLKCVQEFQLQQGKVCLISILHFPRLLEANFVYFNLEEKTQSQTTRRTPTETVDVVLMNQASLLYASSLSASSTCRDYRNILAKHGPRGQGSVPGGGAGEGYAGPQRRPLLLHHGHCQPDGCQWQWTHIPASWGTCTLWVIVMQTLRHTHPGNKSGKDKTLQTVRRSLLLNEKYLFDHTFWVWVGGLCCQRYVWLYTSDGS